MTSENESIPDIERENLNVAIAAAIDSYKKEFGANEPYFSRESVLSKERMMRLIIGMQGGSLKKELHDAGVSASTSAFVQRRHQLSHLDFEAALEHFNASERNIQTFKGYHVLAVDGTCVNLPRNPKAQSFMQNSSNPKGYNQLHVTPLYDVINKVYRHCVIQPQPKQDEIGALLFMLCWYDFPQKTLVVADRGFESYNLFAHFLNDRKADFLIRVKQDRSAMREIGKLPMKELDKEVSFVITTTQTKADKESGHVLVQVPLGRYRNSGKSRARRWDFPTPYPMKFRVVRFKLSTGEYETLATSLPDSITLEDIRELYHARWGIETAFRELKYGLGLVNLHGKSDEFAKQEIYAAMVMSNFCSRIAREVTIAKKEKSIYAYKVNMSMAIHLCRQFYRDGDVEGAQLMRDIAKYTEAVRPGRSDQRNIKAKSFVGFTYRVAA